MRTIHNAPLFIKPPIGNNPFVSIPREALDGDIALLHKVLQAISIRQGTGTYIQSTNVATWVGVSEAMFRVMATKLNRLGYTERLSHGNDLSVAIFMSMDSGTLSSITHHWVAISVF